MSFQNTSHPILLTIIAGSTFGLFTSSHAAELKTSSTIEAVTIFPSSAKATRVATLKIPAGENTLEISDLPIQLIQSVMHRAIKILKIKKG